MVTATTVPEAEVQTAPAPTGRRELTKLDRCDRCGAEAFVIAFNKFGDKDVELLFCNHHHKYATGPNGLTNKEVLDARNWTVVDYSDRLNEKPSVSANAD